ncbi:MAG: hypothetical protein HFH85_06190 [Lachnospiraceae bacterium]|nr:hypothetical protein [Lachnospiraceae bacterium]
MIEAFFFFLIALDKCRSRLMLRGKSIEYFANLVLVKRIFQMRGDLKNNFQKYSEKKGERAMPTRTTDRDKNSYGTGAEAAWVG